MNKYLDLIGFDRYHKAIKEMINLKILYIKYWNDKELSEILSDVENPPNSGDYFFKTDTNTLYLFQEKLPDKELLVIPINPIPQNSLYIRNDDNRLFKWNPLSFSMDLFLITKDQLNVFKFTILEDLLFINTGRDYSGVIVNISQNVFNTQHINIKELIDALKNNKIIVALYKGEEFYVKVDLKFPFSCILTINIRNYISVYKITLNNNWEILGNIQWAHSIKNAFIESYESNIKNISYNLNIGGIVAHYALGDFGETSSPTIIPFASHSNVVQTEWKNQKSTMTEVLLDISNKFESEDNSIENLKTSVNNSILTINTQIQNIENIIPAQASISNKLADKDFVNSSIATNTATFMGLYNSVEELQNAEIDADKNDYAFVLGTDSLGNTKYDRYKWGSHGWMYEYTLNNSSFTAEQWATINSGITAEMAEWLNNLVVDVKHTLSYTNIGGRVFVWDDEPIVRYLTYREEGDNHDYWHMVFKDSLGNIRDFSRDLDSSPSDPYTLDASYTWDTAPLRIKSLFKNDNSYIPTTYSELVLLRNSEQLVPGVSYRIVDYITTTSTPATQSAGHPFDIIVTALDNKTLDEHAKVILTGTRIDPITGEGSHNDYFDESNLNAWEIKYCIDNDTNRFVWADDTDTVISFIGVHNNEEIEFVYDSHNDYGYIWKSIDGETEAYTDNRNPEVGSDIWDDQILQTPWGTVQSLKDTTPTGKGVIYYMKDEYNNECPYDFKNIMFEKTITINSYERTDYYYTFTWVNNEGDIEDASIVASTIRENQSVVGVYNNIIKSCYAHDYTSDPDSELFTQMLNEIIFVSDAYYSNGYFAGIRRNKFDNDCYNNQFRNNCNDNVFGSNCNSNIFGNNCYSNMFGNDCDSNTYGNNYYSNIFKDQCSFNIFGNSCYSNIFGSKCYSNTFGNNCNSNTFGSECANNLFDSNCSHNSFGNNCSQNTFGETCSANSFGNECDQNTFENDCNFNSFGNSCRINSFGKGCEGNSFGDDCDKNSFENDCDANSFGNQVDYITFEKDFMLYNIVENGNTYITVTSTQTTSENAILRNFTIAQGVNNATSENQRKTISHNTTNDTFKTVYLNPNSVIVNV